MIPATPPAFSSQWLNPRICVVAMARNEHIRAHDAMRHYCALFDRVLLIDHCSDDDTARTADAYNGVNNTEVLVYRGVDKGYYQQEYMSACARALLREGVMDWIFFLDFDEFVPFRSRAELDCALLPFIQEPVFHMPWQNLALKEEFSGTLVGARAIAGPPSIYHKIVINARRIHCHDIVVEQGNHAIRVGSGMACAGTEAFALLHIPILSIESLRAKLEKGVEAYDNTDKDAIMGFHWRELKNSIGKLSASRELCREVALNYSMPLPEVIANAAHGRFTPGTREITLDFARISKAEKSGRPDPWLADVSLRNLDHVFMRAVPPRPKKRLSQGEMLHTPFSALPARTGIDGEDIVARALKIGLATPARANAPHLPFVHSLLEVFRPSRHVDAGCPPKPYADLALVHTRLNDGYGELVLAPPDDAAMDYDDAPGNLKVIRGAEWAANLFEPRSIDMLVLGVRDEHDDLAALHRTWSRFLARDSVVLIFGAAMFFGAGGAWQLFDELRRAAAASHKFIHSQGLGVLAYGDKSRNPAIPFLDWLNRNAYEAECRFSALAFSSRGTS